MSSVGIGGELIHLLVAVPPVLLDPIAERIIADLMLPAGAGSSGGWLGSIRGFRVRRVDLSAARSSGMEDSRVQIFQVVVAWLVG